MRVFAAGAASSLEVEVTWASGRRTVVPESPNSLVVVTEGAETQPPAPARRIDRSSPAVDTVVR